MLSLSRKISSYKEEKQKRINKNKKKNRKHKNYDICENIN